MAAEVDPNQYSLLHTANSQHEAEIIHALLEAEGIPAHVEGLALADEFVSFRRLANLVSVQIFVRHDDLEKGREILARGQIDNDDLTRQALEASQSPGAERRHESTHKTIPESVAKDAVRVYLIVVIAIVLCALVTALTLAFSY